MPADSGLAPKPLEQLLPNVEDFVCGEVKEVRDEAVAQKRPLISDYLEQAARQLRSKGDHPSGDAVQFLAAIMQPILVPGDVRRPYHPQFAFGDRVGLVPDNFSDEQIALVHSLAGLEFHPVFKAVFYEMVWLRRREPNAAGEAIRNHLLVAEWLETGLEDDDRNYLSPAFDHIERAVRLSIHVKADGESSSAPLAALLAFGPRMLGLNEAGMFLHAEELVFELRLARTTERAQSIQVAAEGMEVGHTRKETWLLAARLLGSLGERQKESAAKVEAAETMVNLAGESATGEQSSFMAAASHLSEALKIYRQVPSAADRRDELRKLLEEYQQKTRGELKRIETEIDLSDDAKRATEFISGHSPQDAIAVLGFMASSTNKAKLEADVWEMADEYPLQYLINTTLMDDEGRTIAIVPSLLHNDNVKEREVALRYHAFRQAELHYQTIGMGIIEPARQQFCEEHFVSETGIGFMVKRSLFVPEGYEKLFTQGVAAGLRGNFGVALHLLVPQVENALREFAKRQGELTSTKEKSDQISQEALTLGALLEMPSVREMLTENVAFDMECLLTDKLGLRLRHQIAHGQVPDAFFKHAGVARYLFALILKLVVLPLTKPDDPAAEQKGETENDKS